MARRNSKPDSPSTVELSDTAASALRAGRVEQALRCYRELEWLEQESPTWSLRAAECYRRMSQTAGEVSALIRAADRFEQRGFVREAVAMWTRVRAANPELPAADQALRRLQAERTFGLDRLRSSLPPPISRISSVVEATATEPAGLPSIPPAPRLPRVDDEGRGPIVPMPIITVGAESDEVEVEFLDAEVWPSSDEIERS